jgi:homoserine dehydrogenase
VVLDVTASEQLADQYLDFASHGFHVISANKLAGPAAPINTVRSTTRLKKRAPLAV